MRRRTFLQALLSLAGLATIRPARATATAPTGLAYRDSIGSDAATLAALGDGDTATGGIVYEA